MQLYTQRRCGFFLLSYSAKPSSGLARWPGCFDPGQLFLLFCLQFTSTHTGFVRNVFQTVHLVSGLLLFGVVWCCLGDSACCSVSAVLTQVFSVFE